MLKAVILGAVSSQAPAWDGCEGLDGVGRQPDGYVDPFWSQVHQLEWLVLAVLLQGGCL